VYIVREELFILYNLCWVFILHAVLNWTLRVEPFILSTLSSRVLYRLCLVLYWILWRHTGWMSIEHCWNFTESFFSSFHLWCSVNMEDSADIELYEEIVGNPAYSSSSDISKSDPVSFQFKQPRHTECREDFFRTCSLAARPENNSRQTYSRAAILRHVCRVWEF